MEERQFRTKDKVSRATYVLPVVVGNAAASIDSSSCWEMGERKS